MKTRRFVFWILLLLINLGIVEIVLEVFYFHKYSEYPLAIIQAAHSAKRIYFTKVLSKPPIGIFQNDPELGYSHIANTSGTDKCQNDRVTYTIGPEKERFIPKPERPLGRILFLGGSITFGQGVNDDETYAYLLSKYWSQWQVVNKAVMGWGTSHAYLSLSKEIESDHPPSLVIYGFIRHHIRRNYLRRSWINGLAQSGRNHPHFELIGGKIVLKGIVNNKSETVISQNEDSILFDKEMELTKAFLIEMQNKCHQKNVLFVVLLLNKIPASISKLLIENNILFLDLSAMKFEGHPCYKHPNPQDHKQIADAVLKSFIPGLLENK